MWTAAVPAERFHWTACDIGATVARGVLSYNALRNYVAVSFLAAMTKHPNAPTPSTSIFNHDGLLREW